MNAARKLFVDAVRNHFGADKDNLTREELLELVEVAGITYPAWFAKPKYRAERGVYSLEKMIADNDGAKKTMVKVAKKSEPEVVAADAAPAGVQLTTKKVAPVVAPVAASAPVVAAPKKAAELVIQEMYSKEQYVPQYDKTFTPFGYYKKLKKILESKMFLPIFVSGLSGNGKTFITEQTCAQLSREFINVPITMETTEDDLLGGFRLVNGETVWSNGPVVEAMLRGAVLMLDEIDLATHRIMCLQSVVDGKGVYLKKINKFIKAEPGFQIIATANTKGKGKVKGNFVGTNILNEAFLERFAVTFEQDYPGTAIERKILAANLKQFGCDPTDDNHKSFINLLIEWSKQIRKSFDEEHIDEVISTRRLVHIVKYYSIFGDRLDAVQEGTNRFSEKNKVEFANLYSALDSDADMLSKLNAAADGDIEEGQVTSEGAPKVTMTI